MSNQSLLLITCSVSSCGGRKILFIYGTIGNSFVGDIFTETQAWLFLVASASGIFKVPKLNSKHEFRSFFIYKNIRKTLYFNEFWSRIILGAVFKISTYCVCFCTMKNFLIVKLENLLNIFLLVVSIIRT